MSDKRAGATAEKAVDAVSVKKKYKKKSRLQDIWKRMKKNKSAILGLTIFTIIVLCAIFADLIVPYSAALKQDILHRLQPPSALHPFGTDDLGRDMFARIIHATRNSLMVGVLSTFCGISLGAILACIAAYYGGKVDTVIMRLMDVLMCIPSLLLALSIVAALGPNLWNVLIALTLSHIAGYTRMLRSVVLGIVGQDFIEASKSFGARDRWIMFRHLLPNAVGVIIVQATMSIGTAIIAAATLSFLGMGIQPPAPEWGAMLSDGKNYMRIFPYIVLVPGLAISLTALSLNLLGDGLRDSLDPRLRD